MTQKIMPRIQCSYCYQLDGAHADNCPAIKPIPDKHHVAVSGATSSHVPPRYDLISADTLRVLADRLTLGAEQHGERNYQRGITDRDFILNRINHIYEHLQHLISNKSRNHTQKTIEEDLGAILWGASFLCEVVNDEKGRAVLLEIVNF